MKTLAFSTALFFIVFVLSYFLEPSQGRWALAFNLGLFFYFVVLCCCLLWQFRVLWKERFRNRTRNWIFISIIVILSLTLAFVFGIINPDRLYGKDVLIAGREGGGNCHTTFRLKDTQLFLNESFCFGRNWSKGRYVISGDTIRLTGTTPESKEYLFAVIEYQSKKFPGNDLLWFFRNKEDKDPYFLIIYKNDLSK